jgi:hypothetical protein
VSDREKPGESGRLTGTGVIEQDVQSASCASRYFSPETFDAFRFGHIESKGLNALGSQVAECLKRTCGGKDTKTSGSKF